MAPEITVITKRGSETLMSKRISLDETGKVRSDGSNCLMVQGTATRATAATACDLATLILSCRSDQAISLGYLKAGLPDPVAITTKKKLTEKSGAIARTRDFIDYVPGSPGWALIDFDLKGMPPDVEGAIEAAGGMWNALLTVAPGLQRAARVSRASTSAGLYRTDTGEQFAGSGGAHHYVLAKDAGDIERFLRDLHDRCWLHGLGWHLIGARRAVARPLAGRPHGRLRRTAVFRGRAGHRAAAGAGPVQARPRGIRGRGDRHRPGRAPAYGIRAAPRRRGQGRQRRSPRQGGRGNPHPARSSARRQNISEVRHAAGLSAAAGHGTPSRGFAAVPRTGVRSSRHQ